ncbi:MAG: Na/Pi cotransporter family protein [Spirochaetales bacterium]|nr:Na/Pi cotransporter family protein [Spirochaetales bacterium]
MLQSIFTLAGGLALFLLGINYFSDSLKKLSSHQIKLILEKVTSSPLSGTLVGLSVTALIQSSSATTVLTVGFVNSGLMNLSQAIGIIYGANIGTTITAQIMAFNIADYALPILTIGIFVMIFARKDLVKNIATLLVGFGLLFYGMLMMKNAIMPFKNSPELVNIFIKFSYHPILGVLAGMIVTMIIQSSSATVGLTLALIQGGLLTIDSAIPIILGDNIGTCITALLAALGGNISAKRVAAAHFGFNIIGTIWALILLVPYKNVVFLFTKYVTLTTDPVRQAANAHTLFNITNTLLFLPFTKYYTEFIEFIFKGKIEVKEDSAIYLDKNLLKSPYTALEAIVKEINRGLTLSYNGLLQFKNTIITKPSKQNLDILLKNEKILDNIQYEITNYITLIANIEAGEKVSNAIPLILHATNDLERIGDHQQNIYNIYKRYSALSINLPEGVTNKLITIVDKILEFILFISDKLEKNLEIELEIAHKYESEINNLRNSFQNDYYLLLQEFKNNSSISTILYDYVLNLEKIGDHLMNISERLSPISEY